MQYRACHCTSRPFRSSMHVTIEGGVCAVPCIYTLYEEDFAPYDACQYKKLCLCSTMHVSIRNFICVVSFMSRYK